jgi:hypothetical protein
VKAADIEWSMLRGGLVSLVIALVVAGVLVGTSYSFRETNEGIFKRANSERRLAEEEYRKLDELEQMVAIFYPKFQDLERDGVIGEERRLKWTEALKVADENLKFPNLTYSIDTQDRHKTEYPLPQGAYKLFASEMKLDLGLLHGEDLFRLLGRLNEDADGLFTVDSCSFSRGKDAPGNWQDPHLRTTCKLLWYTIKKPGEKRRGSTS